MSFVAEFNSLPLPSMVKRSLEAALPVVRESLAKERLSLIDFANLISPAGGELLEPWDALTRAPQLRLESHPLFAPLYLQ